MMFFRLPTLLTVLATLIGAEVFAEDYDLRRQTVTERARPELDPLGARAGSFMVYPKGAVKGKYHDNIFSTDTDKVTDFVTQVQPGVDIESNWNRHSVNFYSNADLGFYADNEDENYQDYQLGADANIDISHAQDLSASLEHSHEHEARFSPDDVSGINPTELDINRFSTAYRHQLNRVTLSAIASYIDYDFEDVNTSTGGIIDNDDRDRDQKGITLQASYEIVPEYSAFITTSFDNISYVQDVDSNGFNRDSDGFSMTVGSDINFSNVLYGQAYLGHKRREYGDTNLPDTSGVIAGASLTWLASRLTTVKGYLTREIEETTLDSASGSFINEIGISVDHELLRNLLLRASMSLANENFEGIDRKDNYFNSAFGATYMLNRHLYLLMDYEHQSRNTDLTGNTDDFSENIFSFGGQIQL